MLASGSPRRRALLERVGVAHEVVAAGIDESVDTDDPAAEALAVALRKAEAVARRRPDVPVLGADTTLAHDGESLGKPDDRDHARSMLQRLAGASCLVTTGVALVSPGLQRAGTVTARLRLRDLTDAEIDDYLATGAADDKAGALEVQGRAAGFVVELDGCPGTVVGLPLCALGDQLGLDVPPCEPSACVARYGRDRG